MKILVINSHPIQYFAPLYKFLSEAKLNLHVYYCSDENIKGITDKQFGVLFKWDIPLLEDYKYTFLPNQSIFPSFQYGFWGLFNPKILWILWREPKSYVIVHGWQYFTYIIVILFANLFGHEVCLRTETPLSQEMKNKNVKTFIRMHFIKYILFPRVKKFLYIGEQNRRFYEYYGVKSNQLVFTPYSVDNQRFKSIFNKYRFDKDKIRIKLNLPLNKTIILVSGKYIEKKNPLDVIKAFNLVNSPDLALVMVGDGNLRPIMESYIFENQIQNIYLTGFVNQSEIPFYYLTADIFLMYSGVGETWGLSVNEAMNFNLPIITSSITGCSSDLVKEGQNGFIVDSIDSLVDKLRILSQNNSLRIKMGKCSGEIIKTYSFDAILENLIKELI
jgi:glycosyltransferase involved in cell wall biosynthesis